MGKRNRIYIDQTKGSREILKSFVYRSVCFAGISILSVLFFNVQCQPDYDSTENFIKTYLNKNHIPGFAACVIKDNKIIWSKAYGLADIENKIPMSIDAVMNIASISKTITATAVMQLWEKGLIKLDTDINEYLPISIRNPNFPNEPVTIRQILTHTSSIKDGPAYFDSYSCGDPTITLKDWITNYLTPNGKFYSPSENFFTWKPGETRAYSNVAFGLLGYLVEEVSHMPFNEYCSKNIFSPLGMKNTGWFLNETDTTNHIIPYVYITPENMNDDWIKKLAKKYNQEDDLPLNKNFALCFYSFPNYPDGLVRTSVRELSYFLNAIMNNGRMNGSRILKESTIDKMLNLQIEGDNSQGLSWNKREFEALWGHGGGDPGIKTEMFFNPETKIGIITFQNNNMGDSFKYVEKLYLETISNYK